MSKEFNIEGLCLPELHYMVCIEEKLEKIKAFVDDGKYFTINRGRQYGKTTTLWALQDYLEKEYIVVSMDFQMQMSEAKFKNENTFSLAFAKAFIRTIINQKNPLPEAMQNLIMALKTIVDSEKKELELVELFEYLSEICGESDKPVVLMIDEVDSASNNQVFLDFLAQLRGYYLKRTAMPTFRSVILTGVYDIKNLRAKIRPEKEHKKNSPWNIASDFDVDMSLPQKGIAGMLSEYDADYQIGMDIMEMATMIFDYTSGYPFLVSNICKIIDEKIAGSEEYPDKTAAWTKAGVLTAVRMVLTEKNTLFESLVTKLDDFPELNQMILSLLFTGSRIEYNPDNNVLAIAGMFGFIKNRNGTVAIANRIFETRLYNRYLSTEEMRGNEMYKASVQDLNQFIVDGHLNVRRILDKFVTHFHDIYINFDEKFFEDDGRRFFLLYLRPIINGRGNYYIESQTRDAKKTDVIIDYQGEQYIIELKLWRGEEYNNRGEQQLLDYLGYYHLDKGYMLSFNFNKKKEIGLKEIVIGDKVIIEAVV